jgi:hypothetical protein
MVNESEIREERIEGDVSKELAEDCDQHAIN